jgi:hypothetical protein
MTQRIIGWGLASLFLFVGVGCGKKNDSGAGKTPAQGSVSPTAPKEVTPVAPATTVAGADPCLADTRIEYGFIEITENYITGNSEPGFNKYCWKQYYSDTFTRSMEKGGKGSFTKPSVWSFLDGSQYARVLGIQADPAISNPVNDASLALPRGINNYTWTALGQKLDGNAAFQMDLNFDNRYCSNDKSKDVTVEVALAPRNYGTGPIANRLANFGLVINGYVEGTGAAQTLSGYVVNVTTGVGYDAKFGATRVLKLDKAPQTAFAYTSNTYPGFKLPGSPSVQDNPVKVINTDLATAPISAYNYKESKALNGLAPLVLKATLKKGASMAKLSYEIWSVATGTAPAAKLTSDTVTFEGVEALKKAGGFGYVTIMDGSLLDNAHDRLAQSSIFVKSLKTTCDNPRPTPSTP